MAFHKEILEQQIWCTERRVNNNAAMSDQSFQLCFVKTEAKLLFQDLPAHPFVCIGLVLPANAKKDDDEDNICGLKNEKFCLNSNGRCNISH